MLALYNLAFGTGLIVGKTLLNHRQSYTTLFFPNTSKNSKGCWIITIFFGKSATSESLYGVHSGAHLIRCRRVGRVDCDLGWIEASKRHGRFNPKNDIVASTATIIAQVMVKANFFDKTCFQKLNRLFGPVDTPPTIWRCPFIV